ncbi:scavenger mrna-decapping enzyme [Stylonychia lemnae]|uniref:Scavenger mrna-decapping enzyme n=1 Tax=Stylonychia lemnae TaxID=5949 RepID=A0A077ZZ77_STYLE|nr:scavenger mrna-decapping enzyme [Stylonychia lemnae]|eukprot:CDW75256.1 scavenger mrna-decapping enzyme [Stylonychia lemnae]
MTEDNFKKISLRDFKFERTLSNDVEAKQIYLLGTMKGEDPQKKALLKMEKLAFEEKDLQNLGQQENDCLGTDQLILSENHYFQNDVYNKMFLEMNPQISKIQCDFAFPAPQSQIDKYTKQETLLIHETYDMYNNFVKPLFIDKLEPIQWIENVLDGKSELDLQLFRADDYTIKIDWKMNSEDLDTLHLLVFPYDRNLRTVRDLDQRHLQMLESIRDTTYTLIEEKYSIKKSQIRAFFHYHPTFYNMHIHFTHISQTEKVGAYLGRGIFLEDVIENIKIKGDYYQTKTMAVCLGENNAIYRILKENQQI